MLDLRGVRNVVPFPGASPRSIRISGPVPVSFVARVCGEDRVGEDVSK